MGSPISEFDGTGPNDSGSGGGAGGTIDPASLTPGTGPAIGAAPGGTGDGDEYERNADGSVKRNRDGSPRKKRGRKSGGNSGGGSTRPRAAPNKDDLKRSVDALANILMISHMGISGLVNVPEIALEKDDADLLAHASVPVLEQFDFTPDPRFVAVFGLFAAMGKVYGPKVYLYKVRKEAEKEARMKRVNPDFQPSS